MRLEQIKKIAISTMIGSLIAAAGLAVIAVLIGDFSEILGRALFTLFVVAAHSLVCLGFLGGREKDAKDGELSIFTNTLFILLVLSFVTSIFGIWDLATGSVVARLFATYFIAAFAVFHGEMLFKTTKFTALIDRIVIANYFFMAMVIVLLIPLLWLGESFEFEGFYFRLLAAAAIVDATLTTLAVILHNLHLRKHPELKSKLYPQITYVVDADGNKIPQAVGAPARRMHPLVVLLLVFLAFQFVGPIIYMISYGLGR